MRHTEEPTRRITTAVATIVPEHIYVKLGVEENLELNFDPICHNNNVNKNLYSPQNGGNKYPAIRSKT